MELQGIYASQIEYLPRLSIQEDKLDELSQKLIEAGLLQEPENPDVICDWDFLEKLPDRSVSRKTRL